MSSKLQQDPDAKLVVVGNADPKEVAHYKHKNWPPSGPLTSRPISREARPSRTSTQAASKRAPPTREQKTPSIGSCRRARASPRVQQPHRLMRSQSSRFEIPVQVRPENNGGSPSNTPKKGGVGQFGRPGRSHLVLDCLIEFNDGRFV
jgi:hypothetical protein